MKKAVDLAKIASAKLSLVAISVLSLASGVKAQYVEQVEPIEPYTGSLEELVNSIISVVLLAAGVLAVVYLIWGGLTYVTAGGDAEKASKGRVAITNAIIGIIIIIASFAIYRFVVGRISG